MTHFFLFFFLLFINKSRSRERNKTINESYTYSYIINDEIGDFVPSFGLAVNKYSTDVLPIGIYLNPKTGYLFGRPQQTCKVNVTVYGYTNKDVLKENIFIQVYKNTSFFSFSSEKIIYTTTDFVFLLSPVTVSECLDYQIVNRTNNRLKINKESGLITGYFTEPSSFDVNISCSNEKFIYNTHFSIIVEDEYLIDSFPSGILVNYISEPLNKVNRCSFPKYSLFSHPIHHKSIISEINIEPDYYEYDNYENDDGDDDDNSAFISTYDMNMILEENNLITFKLISINSVRMYINSFDDVFMEYKGCDYNEMEKTVLLTKGNVYIHIDYVGNTNNNELLKLYYRIEEDKEEDNDINDGIYDINNFGDDDYNNNTFHLLNNTIISTSLLSFMIKYPNNNNILIMNNTYINIQPIIIGLGYIKYYKMSPELPNNLNFNKENGIIEGIFITNNKNFENENIDYIITAFGLNNIVISSTNITIIYQSVNRIEISSIKTIYSEDHLLFSYYYHFNDESIIVQSYNKELITKPNNNNNKHSKYDELDVDYPIYIDTPIIIEYNTILMNNKYLQTLRLYGDFESFTFYISPLYSYVANHTTADFILDLDNEISYYYVSIVIKLSHINQLENVKCIFNGYVDCDEYFIKINNYKFLLYPHKYITLLYNQTVVLKPNINLKGVYSIDKELPVGLKFDKKRGMINGKVLPINYNKTEFMYNKYVEYTIAYNDKINSSFYLQLYMVSKPYLLLYLNRTDSNKPSFFIFETYSNVSVDKVDYNYGFIQHCDITPFLPNGMYFGRKCEILGIPKNILDYYNFTVIASNLMGEIRQNVSFVIDRCRHGITVNIEISDLDSEMILTTRIFDNTNKYKQYYFEMSYNSTKSVDYCIDDGESTFLFGFREFPYISSDGFIDNDLYFPVNVKISFKNVLNITEFQIDPTQYDFSNEKVIKIKNPPYDLRYYYDYYVYEYGIDSPRNIPLYYNTIKNWTISDELPNNLTFNTKNGIIDGRVAQIMDLYCYTITGCNDVMCVNTEVCLKILAHSCYENEYFYSTLVNQKAYRQCENGYFGYKSEMCIINEVNYTGIPEWDDTSFTEECFLVKHEPYYSYETVVTVSFETTMNSYFFSDKFKGRINFFDLLDTTHYYMNETSFIDTESNNNSVLTKVVFQFTCKERDYYTIRDMILEVLNDISFPNKYIGSTSDYILHDSIVFNPSFYHSIYRYLSVFLLAFFSVLTVFSIIFFLYLCKKANRLSAKKKNRYNMKYYIPFDDENNNRINMKNNRNNKNRSYQNRPTKVVSSNRRKTVYI